MRLRAWPLFLLVLTAQRYPSPGGTVDISFESPDPIVLADDRKDAPGTGLKSRHYKISFYRPGSANTEIAVTDFYDIQTSPQDAFPRPYNELLKTLLWSPQEDFVILPREGWPDKKNAARKAVSLSTSIIWQTTDFTLQESPLIWLNRYTVAGNVVQDCSAAVSIFDGLKGKIAVVRQAGLPYGYEIASSSGSLVLLKKVPGPCATPEEAKALVPECTLYNVSFQRSQITPCP